MLHRLGTIPAAVAPPRRWTDLPGALRLALLTLRLPDVERPVLVDERLGDVLLVRDQALLRALIADRLAPLQQAKTGTRERLVETLLSRLSHRGARNAVARELHLHPQTIAYRVGLLRELFGTDLDDPRARFELEVALRGRQLIRES